MSNDLKSFAVAGGCDDLHLDPHTAPKAQIKETRRAEGHNQNPVRVRHVFGGLVFARHHDWHEHGREQVARHLQRSKQTNGRSDIKRMAIG